MRLCVNNRTADGAVCEQHDCAWGHVWTVRLCKWNKRKFKEKMEKCNGTNGDKNGTRKENRNTNCWWMNTHEHMLLKMKKIYFKLWRPGMWTLLWSRSWGWQNLSFLMSKGYLGRPVNYSTGDKLRYKMGLVKIKYFNLTKTYHWTSSGFIFSFTITLHIC